MRFKAFLILIVSSLVLTGCFSRTTENAPTTDSSFESRPTQVETPVSLDDFEDIHPNQIGETIEVNGDVYALVQQPNLNVPLALPDDFELQFVGVLKQVEGDKWIKFAQLEDLIQEGEGAGKNNPIAMWQEKADLRLAVVDQTGAGSGEGTFKLFTLRDDRIWVQESCGYYNPDLGSFFSYDDRIQFEYYQFNSVAKSYQRGPVFDKELGEERMVDQPTCDNAFVTVVR